MIAVPYRLRRVETAVPATALLLLSDLAGNLLALVARLDADPWPEVYRVPGGFLVKLTCPLETGLPPALRLRGLADDLFVPADAELEPGLLADEAAALVRTRGLVFLPGGRVLGYAVDSALSPAELLTAPRLDGAGWAPLPPRPEWAERLHAVLLDRPDDAPEVIVERGGAGIGEEEARPAGSGPLASAGGAAAVGLAGALLWLANLFRWRGLANAAAAVARAALDRVPRISEALLGKQEAALRDLLREFREGSLEAALRRALPLWGDAERGSAVAGDAELPRHDTRFSLRDLLATRGGTVARWYGGHNVAALLAAEYRKVAQAAADRGDHRRAAFIYAKLLGDFRLAAAVLERGGLHHDAAVLYLDKIGDRHAAARAFEAAGEVDRALRLYREQSEHALAGDLLRRAGDEEAALVEYGLAASELANRPDWLAAGDLLRDRAGRPDLATEYYDQGWFVCSVPCGLRLMDYYADRELPDNLLELLQQARERVDRLGRPTDVVQFYQHLARIADRPRLASLRDDLRDRALLALAGEVRQRAEVEVNPGTVVAMALSRSGLWEPALVSDADYAFKAAVQKNRAAPPPRVEPAANRVRLGKGTVTAICAATETGVVFAGFDDGSLVAFDPASGTSQRLPESGEHRRSAVALSTDKKGDSCVVVRVGAGGAAEICSFSRVPFAKSPLVYTSLHGRPLAASEVHALTPIWSHAPAGGVGYWDGTTVQFLGGLDLVPIAEVGFGLPAAACFAAAFCPYARQESWPSLLLAAGRAFRLLPNWNGPGYDVLAGWCPTLPAGSALHAPPLSWLHREEGRIELAGVGGSGDACWCELRPVSGRYEVLQSNLKMGDEPYRAAAVFGPGRIAAVRKSGVDWLRAGGGRLAVATFTASPLADAVACFFSRPTQELFVACAAGELARVPVPS